MDNHRSMHLSDEQLAGFEDGEASAQQARHMETCPECGIRLRDLKSAGARYVEYRYSIRDPALPEIPKPWKSLDLLIAEHETVRPRPTWRWWIPALAAALCLLVAALVFLRRPAQQPLEASDLLAQSENAELPSNRMITMRLQGRTLVRPAVLANAGAEGRDREFGRVEALFVQANYSWREPLSARSFQNWRKGLSEKRDTVSVIHAGGPERVFRLRTDTERGVLRSASLTLQGTNLHPASGAFKFEGGDFVEMDDGGEPAPASDPPKVVRKEAPVETPATPAETLHVLAALNAIGADVGDPISVSEDAQRLVVVRANGLSPDRRRQVANALKPFSRVKLDLDATLADAAATRPATPERFSTNIPAALRQQFETRLGGAAALQEITDRVLDNSGSAVARAHAIEVLATRFPPEIESALTTQDRELLHSMQQGHNAELRRLIAQIRNDLQPLLPASTLHESSAASSWQAHEAELFASAHKVDSLLNRLLAGSYSQSSGETMLHTVADELEHLNREIQFQQASVK